MGANTDAGPEQAGTLNCAASGPLPGRTNDHVTRYGPRRLPPPARTNRRRPYRCSTRPAQDYPVGASGVALGRRLRLSVVECVCTYIAMEVHCRASYGHSVRGRIRFQDHDDQTAPGPVPGVGAARDGGRVVLRWTNPSWDAYHP
jgi:hypothetical protein